VPGPARRWAATELYLMPSVPCRRPFLAQSIESQQYRRENSWFSKTHLAVPEHECAQCPASRVVPLPEEASLGQADKTTRCERTQQEPAVEWALVSDRG